MLQLIHRKKNVSRVELVKLTGLSAGLITGITHALISKGLVTEALGRPSTAGRKPLALKVRHDAAYVVGVDLAARGGSSFVTAPSEPDNNGDAHDR